MTRVFVVAIVGFGALLLSGCDPVVNIAGANFPAWLLCAISGALLALILRPLFTSTGLEPHLGPLVVIYPSLAILLGCLVFLIFFNRV
ncbi:MAG TPA: YtcA family lipoprotein [Candidatus Binataceae bacterium]|nr:YtcA family lipoprotein [Candidatus Binataceae bacterium]